jgi:hypothetical protein
LREKDVLGLAATYVGISSYARRFGRDLVVVNHGGTVYAAGETSVKLTYLYQVTR